jgi:hypothetical protein
MGRYSPRRICLNEYARADGAPVRLNKRFVTPTASAGVTATVRGVWFILAVVCRIQGAVPALLPTTALPSYSDELMMPTIKHHFASQILSPTGSSAYHVSVTGTLALGSPPSREGHLPHESPALHSATGILL